MSDPAPRRIRARVAASLLLLLAIWEVGVLVSAGRSAPSRADWEAVAAAIPRPLHDDQLIVFAPRWLDPVGRKWLGDRISVNQAARMDTARYRQIWEVSIRGAAAPEVAHEPAVSEQAFGPIRVRRFVHTPAAVTWSLTEGTQICEVDFEPHRGMVLDIRRPFGQGRRVFQQVPLGDQLQVYIGLADYKKRSVNQSQALVQAIVDGREVARGFAANDGGWIALPMAETTPGTHDVEFLARVQDPRGRIELSICVAAEARMRRR